MCSIGSLGGRCSIDRLGYRLWCGIVCCLGVFDAEVGFGVGLEVDLGIGLVVCVA